MIADKRFEVPVQAVPTPILNSPYEEPKAHWIYKDGAPFQQEGRRPASYWYKEKGVGTDQGDLFAEEARDDLVLVNRLRKDVGRWRKSGYKGASQVTKTLLKHWADPIRGRRLFFCQLESVETLIYLLEVAIPGRLPSTDYRTFEVTQAAIGQLLNGEFPDSFTELRKSDTYYPKLVDRPADESFLPLTRMGCKMATGSGKTLVMAMMIAWAFCNRSRNPASRHFPNAVVVCAPNLTVKSRLQVLRADTENNYYDQFNLVPTAFRDALNVGKVLVTNWHTFALASENSEGDKTYKVVQKGEESPEAFTRNRLSDLADRLPLLVLNDEGHHCWRPAPVEPKTLAELEDDQKETLKSDLEEARVWLAGLDFINNSGLAGRDGDVLRRGVLACIDLSATPYYLAGSGYVEGSPFPWLVSDFGLVDAIESGIVKVPRLPVKDSTGATDEAGRPDPEYFRLWDHVVEKLTSKDKVGKKWKADALYREAEPALLMLYSQWKAKYAALLASSRDDKPIPPALIVVCDNTDLAQAIYEAISGEKKNADGTTTRTTSMFPEFQNSDNERHTFRIDSKLLALAEAEGDKTKDEAALAQRNLINTVGVRGKPGEQVRCVVSVSMLTEGWDANNVTHVFGLRPFRSQLLCEQVVGRGLRRMSYTPDPITGLLPAEYVDVYGIPFSLIPFKGKDTTKPEPPEKPYHNIFALPEREAFEIRIPVVEGYTYALRESGIKCNVDAIEEYEIDEDPTHVYLAVTRGIRDLKDRVPEADFVKQDKTEFYRQVRVQQIIFKIAQHIVEDLEHGQGKAYQKSRHQLFPEVLKIVEAFVERRVRLGVGVDKREIAAVKHVTRIRELLLAGIVPKAASEEAPLIPLVNRFRPAVVTGDVNYRTSRDVEKLEKSHLNYAELRSNDEALAIRTLENAPKVRCFAPNSNNLGLSIGYEYEGNQHQYIPDFIVEFQSADETRRFLLLEIKGVGGKRWEPNQVNIKSEIAKKWCDAVTNLKRYGQWTFEICEEPVRLSSILANFGKDSAVVEPWKIIMHEFQKPWQNCLPVVALKTAAGYWSREQLNLEDAPEWADLWVQPEGQEGPWPSGSFIAQVQGDSMEPRVPNGSWCIFTPPKAGSREGRAVLVWHSGISDPHTGGQYTLKVYHSEKKQDEESDWVHNRVVLKPLNPAYNPIVLEPQDEGEVRVLAELSTVLRAEGGVSRGV